MDIGSSTPAQQLTPLKECFSINDVRTLVAKQLRVDVDFVTSETHFTDDLGADLLDRVELMLAIEDQFSGVEITDEDVEQIQVVGDLIHHLNIKCLSSARISTFELGDRLRCARADVRGAISEH
jgi:acyl carrier protein